MNPDNPTFRTPEEEARAKEYVRLKEENARLRAALQQIEILAGSGEGVANNDCYDIACKALEGV